MSDVLNTSSPEDRNRDTQSRESYFMKYFLLEIFSDTVPSFHALSILKILQIQYTFKVKILS